MGSPEYGSALVGEHVGVTTVLSLSTVTAADVDGSLWVCGKPLGTWDKKEKMEERGRGMRRKKGREGEGRAAGREGKVKHKKNKIINK